MNTAKVQAIQELRAGFRADATKYEVEYVADRHGSDMEVPIKVADMMRKLQRGSWWRRKLRWHLLHLERRLRHEVRAARARLAEANRVKSIMDQRDQVVPLLAHGVISLEIRDTANFIGKRKGRILFLERLRARVRGW